MARGIAYLRLPCAPGSAEGIARFYSHALAARVSLDPWTSGSSGGDGGRAVVWLGPGVRLVFVEDASCALDEEVRGRGGRSRRLAACGMRPSHHMAWLHIASCGVLGMASSGFSCLLARGTRLALPGGLHPGLSVRACVW